MTGLYEVKMRMKDKSVGFLNPSNRILNVKEYPEVLYKSIPLMYYKDNPPQELIIVLNTYGKTNITLPPELIAWLSQMKITLSIESRHEY